MPHTKGHITTGKSLVKYSKSKALLQKIKHIGSKASGEQKFLGKTLPRMAWGAAKWAWRHPIASTALTLAPAVLRKLAKQPGHKFPQHRKWTKSKKGKYFL